jgi:S-(hydroxymethyl)glutathione dehydrogenase/alcohol dehydrogenase
MKSRAAVAWEAKKPLTIETVEIGGPRAGEVLVEIMATGVCHTDAYTLSGLDSEASSRPFSAMKVRASCAKSAQA